MGKPGGTSCIPGKDDHQPWKFDLNIYTDGHGEERIQRVVLRTKAQAYPKI